MYINTYFTKPLIKIGMFDIYLHKASVLTIKRQPLATSSVYLKNPLSKHIIFKYIFIMGILREADFRFFSNSKEYLFIYYY